MFQQISILVILLLGIIQARAFVFLDENFSNNHLRSTSVSMPMQEIVDHRTGATFTVSSREGAKILRTQNNIFRLTEYHNFAGPYNAIEFFTGGRFSAIDLGANKYRLSQAYIQDNMLRLRMLDGNVYSYCNHRLEDFETAQQ
ncbi:MAG: hypothetical protein K2Q34_00265 [Alphaproteobacteria bacterium]|nr:hypothetical protein [Alphaproteobacteria bacterium]